MNLAFASDESLAHKVEWLRLLDYKETFFGGYKSQVTSKKFFLAKDGPSSPQDELKKDMEMIFSPEKINDKHARCLFPARAFYLAQKLNRTLPSEDQCPEFTKFKNSFKAESVSLVFSSYYVNNPSSTFGHTFLRFNQHRSYQDTDLTDLSVNYGSNPWTKNPLLYTIGGVTGWFDGTFVTLPYYYKVREYNNAESRDLWSYELNLTAPEINQLIRHLWELGLARYDYYFFTQNCAYHIITALEAAAPRLEISKNLPYWVIPTDTILATKDAGAIRKVSYRPSARNTFIYHLSQLDSSEQKDFYKLRDSRNAGGDTKVIDVLLDWIDYKYFTQVKNEKSPIYHWQQTLLEERAALPTTTQTTPPESPIKPHEGHPSARLGLEVGRNKSFDTAIQRYHMRFALHDLLDPDGGYPDNTQVEFFNLIVQSRQNLNKFDLSQFDLVDVISLNPWREFEKSFSWKFDLGTRSMYKKDCRFCQAVDPTGGVGIAFDITKLATFYVFAQGGPFYSNNFNHQKLRIKVGSEAGLLFKPFENFKFLANYDWYYDVVRKNKIYKTSFSGRKSFGNNFGVGATTSMENGIGEYTFEGFYYF